MDIEDKLLKLYYDFLKEKSTFKDILLVVPSTPQSFSKFPTIVFKQNNSSNILAGKSLDRQEYVDRLTYTVEIYSKDVTIGNTKYVSRNVMKEIIELTHIFFNDVGFNRLSSQRGEYIDLTIDRHICLFEGRLNNWNNILN